MGEGSLCLPFLSSAFLCGGGLFILVRRIRKKWENHYCCNRQFPRIGEGENGQKLRKAFHDFDKGRLNSAELLEVERGITVQAISLQQKRVWIY